MTEGDVRRSHEALVARIREAGERWKRQRAGTGLMRLLGVLALVAGALVAVEAFVVPSSAARLVLLALALAALVAAFLLWVAKPLAARLDPVSVAERIERARPDLGERLEASAELWSKRGAGRHGYSIELIDALILKTVAEVSGVALAVSPRPGERARAIRSAAVMVAAAAVVVLIAGDRVAPAVGRLANPLVVPEPPGAVIGVEPGDVRVVAGEDLAVTASIAGTAVAAPTLSFRLVDDAVRERRMSPSGDGTYRSVLRNVRADLQYSVRSGEHRSRTFDVTVIERPFVTGIRLDYDYPDYSGLLPRTVAENNGDIMALAGTDVRVTVTASKPLERAALVLQSGGTLEMNRSGDGSFAATLTVGDDDRYSIHVEDGDGLENSEPPTYSIVSIRDERPLVRVVEPGEDRDAPRGMTMPIAVSAVDDHGITALRLRYSLEGSAEETVLSIEEHRGGAPRELASEFEWDLSETGLLPGRSLVYYAQVEDNDSVTGPKTADSESYLIRFPTMSELYSDVSGEQDDMLDELDGMLEEQTVLKERFEKLRDELRSEPEMDWQDEERVEEALSRQEDMADDVEDMTGKLAELSDSMSETDRVTLETLEKVDEITRLLDEVADEEMRELIERIREAMRSVNPEDVSEAMESLSVTQDDYLKRLEQTLNLLRRAKAEQELADAANRAEDLGRREEQLASDAERAQTPEESERLAREQEQLKREAEQLQSDLDRAIENMRKVDQSAAENMQAAADEMKANDTIGKMEEARERFTESKPSEAASSCASASSDLLALFSRLSDCQSGAACSLQNRDREATLRAIDELLGVSAEQEKVVEAVENRRRIPREELVALVAKETDLSAAMSDIAARMFRVSKDSFVIDPSVFRAFGSAQMMMNRAAAHIADGGSAAGHKEARAALGSINSLVVSLLTSNQSSSGSSGGAMQQLMDQLRQLGEQQSDLNDMTEELERRMQELGMSAGAQRQVAEMRARQEQLLEEARRLAREFGDQREILGRLDQTVEEMERTVEEMERSGASQDVINRQKRILSRLLDAQRSLRRRDYTRERRSATGEDMARGGPDDLPAGIEEATRTLREDLLRAMQGSYPPEYRELIRAYFQGLTSDLQTQGAGESE